MFLERDWFKIIHDTTWLKLEWTDKPKLNNKFKITKKRTQITKYNQTPPAKSRFWWSSKDSGPRCLCSTSSGFTPLLFGSAPDTKGGEGGPLLSSKPLGVLWADVRALFDAGSAKEQSYKHQIKRQHINLLRIWINMINSTIKELEFKRFKKKMHKL